MTLTDELMTPGCPNCVIKHMSAALAYMAENPDRNGAYPMINSFANRVYAARAAINLVEAYEGYKSHYDYAVGLLVRSEELSVASNDAETADKVRYIRLDLMKYGPSAAVGTSQRLFALCSKADIVRAHLDEAAREAPSDIVVVTGIEGARERLIAETIETVRKNYFDQPEEPEKGGEEVMACCKKGKCAAAKGGKANAKLPVKGGKKVAKKGGK